ncbi:MAG TPA: penicillin acylase family protein [Chitinophagaceae bacterium]|nr:penicillin acylase family protein [Chitinophagaceae bacterium]
MRIFFCILYAAITIALIVVLDMPLTMGGTKTPRLGYFLSPQKGFWQNAEAADAKFNGNLRLTGLQGKTEVYFDDRLVPHVYADNDADAYFVEGYLHAKFRLWQMEFQTYAAAGRLSEIFGDSANGTSFLNIDIYFRRLGMVYGAEKSLKAMEADANTKQALDAYTAGVNAYINTLDEASYPLEYKLLDYAPEPWTNLKSALFLKYMSYDLTGGDNDFELTNAKTIFSKEQFEKLFPYGQDSVQTIIPKGTPFVKPGITLKIPATVDSLYFNYKDTIKLTEKPVKPNPDNGSNNWAVSGIKTKSGRPILCNDPHLGLNLPSLWYEIQLSTPTYNVYGVSFPGSPAIIIGFNDSCAWGVTNAGRDVKDYYEITFQDSTESHYLYNYEWKKAGIRKEVIKIKGKPDHVENIPLTIWGPVMYDKSYGNPSKNGKAYAIHWTAHDESNELRTFIMLDRARNLDDYKNAISTFKNPGQNFLFASKHGNIAIEEEGNFPAKWRRQGDFVMPGKDSSYAIQNIPDSENIMLVNPPRGFLSSANQYPYDTTYPYYMGGIDYEYFRPNIINRNLASMQNITPGDMERLQTDNYNLMAEMARPPLLKYLDTSSLSGDEKKYLAIFTSWNLRNDGNEQGPTVFKLWWDSLKYCMYNDEFSRTDLYLPEVANETLLRALRKDSLYEFADDINTPKKETVRDIVTASFKKTIPVLQDAEKNGRLVWGTFKNSGIRHLLKIPSLSRLHLFSGGGDDIINAYTQFHGPSWRMVVQLTDETEAYGLYPGGQSGNPGSKYYDTFIDKWLVGQYYPIHIFKKQDIEKQQNLLGVITFSK